MWRVAHRALLVEEAGVGARLDVPPGAPLVQHQADLAVRVVRVHHRGVPADHPLDVLRLGDRPVVAVQVELGRPALALPRPGDRVVMERDGLEDVARVPAASREAEACTCGSFASPSLYSCASHQVGSSIASWCTLYISKTW